MRSDDEHSASDGDGSVATANTVLDSVPVDVSGPVVAKLRCKLCFAYPTEMSPLALATDPIPSRIEWRQYWKRKLEGRVVAKIPRSKLCNWCAKTFYNLGWEDEFSTIQAYAKTISSINKERHQQFLAARKAVIKSHLKHEGGTRGRMTDKDKRNVSDAGTTLDTLHVETTRLYKPKLQFVTLDSWDVKLDGPKDLTKVVEKNVFGTMEKGIWKRIGRQGVYDAAHFEDLSVEERTRETDDTGPLGKLRMDHKRLKMRSLIDNREKARQDVAVDGPAVVSSVQDIMNMLGSLGHDKAAASGDGDNASSSSSSSSSSDSSDEHAADAAGGSTKSRLDAMFNEKKRTPGGASGSVSGSAHADNTRGKLSNAGAPAEKKGSLKNKSGSAIGVKQADKPGSAQVDRSHLSSTGT